MTEQTEHGIAAVDWRDRDADPEQRIAALLAEMTPAEKAAQLGSYWNDRRDASEIIAPMQDVMGAGRPPFEVAVEHGVGHLTRHFGTTPVAPRTGMERARADQLHLRQRTRLGIPAIIHEECLTGATTLGATVYPTPMAWASTFDPELVREMAAAIGADLHALGVHQGLSPVLDVVTDYRWGRVEETLGEDPHVVATLATAYVEGLQSAGVIATLKHFAGHASSRGGRNHAPVSIGERELRDLVLPPFEMAVRRGRAGSVMNSYTETDRVPAAADRRLLTEVLREEWGFTGTVVSDYWAVAFLMTKHRVAATVAEAGRLALHAGMDVELPDTAAFGRLGDGDPDPARTAAEIDEAVRRVLRQKLALGLLDAEWTPPAPIDHDLDSPRNRDVARRLAESSVVLLDNPTGLLPLDRSTARVAVIGPGADDPRVLMGAYSYPIHVLPRHPELGFGLDVQSIADAMRTHFAAEVRVEAGVPLVGAADDDELARAVDVARASDVVVAVVGDRAGMFGKGTSGEGSDAPDLELPGEQGRLVEALHDTGTPVVLVVVSGRPYALGRYTGRAAALVQAFFPGVEGPGALARVLTGEVNPSGHLPVEIPRTDAALPHTSLAPPLGQDGDRISSLSTAAAFPFGHGLSYTRFELGELELDAGQIDTGGTVTAAVRVENTGDRDGAVVVQLYAADPVAEVTRPVLQLVGFARVRLAAGAAADVEFELHADRFSFVGLAGRRIVEPGAIELSAGTSSAARSATRTLTLTGARRDVVDAVLHTPVRVTEVRS